MDGFAARLLEDEKQRHNLYERALDNKVFTVIRENVKLEEQEISMADFEPPCNFKSVSTFSMPLIFPSIPTQSKTTSAPP